MLLTAPPPALVQAAQPRRNQYPPLKREVSRPLYAILLELMNSPELAPLLQEDAVPGKPLPPLRPVGLDNILFSPADLTVITQGTPDAEKAFAALIKLLESEPRSVLVKMRLVSKDKPEIRPAISTLSNTKGVVGIGDARDLQKISMIPHLNRDGKTVAIAAQVNKEKWLVQTVKLGAEAVFSFPNNQTLFVTATQP